MINRSNGGSGRYLAIIVIVALFVFGFGIGFAGEKVVSHFRGLGDGQYEVLVCTTTDLHGAYFSKDYEGNEIPRSLANVSSYLRMLRSHGLDPVLLDVGDCLQGNNAAYYYNYVDTVSEHVFASMEKYLGYDAMIVGNHDIEAGHSVYDRMKTEYGVPLLAANALHSGGRHGGEPYFEPYTIIRRGKLKIAVIGMTNANIGNWLSEDVWSGMEFVPVSQVAQQWVDKVNGKERPDITILAMHSGAGIGDEASLEAEGFRVASEIKGVDLVVLGHDHTARAQWVGNPAGDVFVVNGGCYAETVAQVVITLEVKDRKVVSKSVSGIVLSMDGYGMDPEFVNEFKPQYDTVRKFATAPMGMISEPISFAGVLDGPSAFLGLVHGTQLRFTGADISVTAPLSTEGGIEAGVVAFKDLAKIYKFENHLYKVSMTGRQIKGFLELAYYNCINRIGPQYNYDSADGIIYEVSLSAEKGEKVNILSLSDGRPFCLDSTYTVAMNSYRASGGGYLLRDGAGIDPSDLPVLERYKDIRSMIGDYIRECGVYSPSVPDNWKFVR